MKLTKKTEAEVIKVYDAWLNAYLNGDVKTYDFYLDDSYHFIGSTNNEEFLNRKDTTKFFEKTANQLAGKTELKNRIKTIELFDGLVFITEFFDAYFLIGNEWTYYGRFRFTSVTRKNKEGWRFIYQHFSMPDSKSDDGQTIGFDKVHSENLELKEAIKRRTVELDLKNRELEIEAALEKVRSRTMAMQHSDELQETANKLFLEVQALGIPSWSCGFNILSEDKTTCKSWMSSEGKLQQPFTLIFKKEASFIEMYEFFKSDEILLIQELEGDAIRRHYDYMKSLPSLMPIFDDFEKSGIPLPTYQINHLCKFKGGYLLFITYEKVPKAHDVFKRFTKIFEQTYTRFLDLQKAEAQAREAEIELALERVRARTMAMQRSEELLDVATVLFQQVKALGVPQWNCGFNIWNKGDAEFTYYPGSPDGIISPSPCKIPLTEHPIFKQFDASRNRGDELLIYEKEGEIQEDHYRYMLSLPGVGELLQSMLDAGFELPTFQIDHIANFKYGNMIFITYRHFPEMHDVFKRFAKVFEQTYTRFLDLQKAEAQAREAQIETALERVRSRSMAMHQSDELKDVIKVIFDQMAHLNINAEHAGIVVDYEPNKDWHFWVAETQDIPARITVPYLDLVWDRQFTKAKKKGKDFFTTQLKFEEKNSFYKELLPHIQGLTKKAQDFYFSCPGLAASTVIQKDIGLYIENFSGIPYTDEENSILMRIGKVFQQTYTRFLDLQKAEAQAREAQIEAALERVRSRTMAMQHSTELSDTSALLFQQIQLLGIPPWSCGFNIWETEDTVFTSYMGSPDGGILKGYKIPLTEEAAFIHFKESRDRGDKLFIDVLEGDALETHYRYFQTLPGIKEMFEKRAQAGFPLPSFQIHHLANFSHGNLMFITYEHCPEAHDIFIRFAKVFEQTYTRFLDLQKAEAQAREAQIEAALERVRSQSMGMQSSKDFGAVTTEMFNQLRRFDGDLFATGIVFCDKHKGHVEQWHSIPGAGMLTPFIVPVDLDYIHQYRFDEWKKGTELFSVEIPEHFIEQHFSAIFNLPSAQIVLKDFESRNTPMPKAPDWEIDYGASFKNGYILVSALKPFKEVDILPRFAKVFEQTYTRFLDLQKVEAQAREAQIESGLERVRSRSLAMHKTSELQDVIHTVHQELLNLNIAITGGSFIAINSNIENELRCWGSGGTADTSTEVILPQFKKPFLTNLINEIKKGSGFFTEAYTQKEKKEFFTFLFKYEPWSKLKPKEKKEMLTSQGGYTRSGYVSPHTSIFIINHFGEEFSDPDNAILMRFGKVFEQAYTRFLDLQKAEAQTREAQIEVSLERVRSRAMAMHHTDELTDVLCVLFDQFDYLGINPVLTHLTLMDEENETFSLRITTTAENRIVAEQLIDINAIDAWKDSFKNWKNSEPNAVDCIDYTPEQIPIVFELLQEVMDALPEGHKIYPEDFPNGLYTTQGHFKFGYIGFNHTRRATEEEKSIVERFAKEFGRTYQRFLDLQKAEAQTREAQIEAALERVRSRSMAMHKSEELLDVISVVSEQLQQLEFKFIHVSFANNDISQDYKFWTASKGMSKPMRFNTPYLDITTFNNLREAQEKSVSFYTDILTREEHIQSHKHLLKHGGSHVFSKEENEFIMSRGMARSIAINPNIMLILANYASIPYSEDDNKIIERFGQVFEQAYTRFLDLQKAEAQTREAQIEAALEKVRSRSLAMHQSTEMQQVANEIQKQLLNLGLDIHALAMSGVIDNETDYDVWVGGANSEKPLRIPYNNDTKVQRDYNKAIKERPELFTKTYTGKTMKAYFKHLMASNSFNPEIEKFMRESSAFTTTLTFMKNSGIQIIRYTDEAFSDEDNTIVKRFGKVFEQAYIRFLDLQKAEQQARESQIEASLERVRAKTMAMHKSSELSEVAAVLFEQISLLTDTPSRFNIAIVNEPEKLFDIWVTDQTGQNLNKLFIFEVEKSEVVAEVFKSWKADEKHIIQHLTGQRLKNWITYAIEEAGVPFDTSVVKEHRYINSIYFKQGLLGITTDEMPENSVIQLLERFAKVFEQTYTRFLDLQKAEAQARESQIETALEKVRSRTMAMQQSDELPEAANNLFMQVQELGIPAWSAGYNIWNDDKSATYCSMSSEGELQKGFMLPSIGTGYDFYNPLKNGESFSVQELGGEALVQHYEFMRQLPSVGDILDELIKSGISLPTFQIFHIVYFKFGFVMFITYESVPDAHSIFKRFGQVFEQTYTRFLDLKLKEEQSIKLEQEKQRLEKTLSDLQETQKQLIQSEKMASLGELTAGIAHEIQNPLNFVNNFSEVSKELLDEMKEELHNGNLEDAMEIMQDIIQNLEKINHHGKRADGIVKGMLQHSRNSSGSKEPTDINALADEYLRLAYHGLRAKDKSFNATMVSDFDDNIGHVNVIPQDIGRVILNLITNAFYVVDEKKKTGIKNYEPTVTVRTKKGVKNIEIQVADNGNGIPEKILNKIFEPFFTTKPTGKGTGLGLSMSYDIVTKSHGGELKVLTKEGEGTEFIIVLPINKT